MKPETNPKNEQMYAIWTAVLILLATIALAVAFSHNVVVTTYADASASGSEDTTTAAAVPQRKPAQRTAAAQTKAAVKRTITESDAAPFRSELRKAFRAARKTECPDLADAQFDTLYFDADGDRLQEALR